MVTSRDLVKKALRFDCPSRIPRHLWLLPAAVQRYPEYIKVLENEFPSDIVYPPMKEWILPWGKGDPYKKGVYIDAWGSEWLNIQDGIIGEVKKMAVADWVDLETLKVPYSVVGQDNENIQAFVKTTDKFVIGGLFSLSTRMEALRGSENLYMDLAFDIDHVKQLRDIVHNFNLKYIEALLETDIDALMWGDDWGSQTSLLINPNTWREVFKPCYAEYAKIIHNAGKFVFMHSDGYIMEIYQDLIEIGIDAINSQIFCMPIEEIGKKHAGKITFWGEIDRQNMLVSASEANIRRAVRHVWDNLSSNGGGVIAQLEFGLEAKPENVLAAFDEWQRVTNGLRERCW